MYESIKNIVVRNFVKDETGLTVVEYVVAAALIVGVITLVFVTLQTALPEKFDQAISSAGN